MLNFLSFDHKYVPFYVEPGHTVNILIHQDGRTEYTDEEGKPAPCAAYLSSNIDDINYLTWNQYEEDLKNLSFREYGKKIDDLMAKAEKDLSYLANRYGFTSLDYAVARTEMLITLGTAMEKALEPSETPYPSGVAYEKVCKDGPSVAISDSIRKDSAALKGQTSPVILK